MSRERFYQTSKEILRANNKEASGVKESSALAKAKYIKVRAEQGDDAPFEAIFIRAKQFIEELDAQKELLKLNETQSLKDTQDKEEAQKFNQLFCRQCDILRDRIKDFISNMFGYDLNEMQYTYDKAD